jgi:hypothetical protein
VEKVNLIETDCQQLRSQSKVICLVSQQKLPPKALGTDQMLSLQCREKISDGKGISGRDAMNETSKRGDVVFALTKSARDQGGNGGGG